MAHSLRNMPSTTIHRDYGATSNTTTTTAGDSTSNLLDTNITSINSNPLPEVNFSGFSPTEFVSLSETIGHNISAINSHSRQLEKILKILGTDRDLPTIHDRIRNIIQKCNNRINMTSIDLQGLAIIVKRGDKQQKLQLERLSTEFCEVVEKYANLQKMVITKVKQCKQQQNKPFHFNEDNNGKNDQNDNENAKNANNAKNASNQQHADVNQQQLLQQLQFEYDTLVDREEQIKQIESEVLDVNAIMQKISVIMRNQGEDLERIETGIENIASDAEIGREELMKASGRRQTYRRRMFIIFIITVIIGLIVTGIVFSKLINQIV